MSEQLIDLAWTTVAAGGYAAGSGVLNVPSTSVGSGALPFPITGVFSVSISDPTTRIVKTLLKVTAVNSPTQWAVVSIAGLDVNCVIGDLVEAVQDKRAQQARGVIGTVVFSASGGVIGNLVVAGVIANVVRAATGAYNITFTATQANYTISVICNNNNAGDAFCFLGGVDTTPPGSGFGIACVLSPSTLFDPDLVMITIHKF